MYDLGNQFKPDKTKLIANPECVFTGDKYRLTVLSERLIRLEYREDGKFIDTATPLVVNRLFSKPPFNVREDKTIIEIETNYFLLTYEKNKPFRGSKLNPTKYLSVICKFTQEIWYLNHPEVKNFHGNNKELTNFDINKQNKENNGFYSADGFVSLDDSYNYKLNENAVIEKVLRNNDNHDIYLFVHGKDLGYAFKDYFTLTGFPSLPPRYAFGNWWSSVIKQNKESSLDIINNFIDLEIPLSVYMFDKTWRINKGSYGTFTFNDEVLNEKDMLDIIDILKQNKIKIGLNVNPLLKLDPEDYLYEQVIKFIEPDKNKSVILDLTNAKHLDLYLKFFVHTFEKKGIDFFWNDLKDNDLKKQWLVNHYHSLDIEREMTQRRMILGRNSGIAAHRYPVLYSGETKVSWDNFKSIPYFNVSSSNIGVNLWSHDIFGYEGGIEDPELYIRSVELGVVSPILRFRKGPSKYYKREPWLWEEKVKAVVSRYLKFRHMLIPYFYTENYKYATRGILMFMPLYYVNAKLIDDAYYRNEYFLGSELFVAPIVNKMEPIINRTLHRFFLPSGTWYDYFTGKKFNGNKKYLGFYREEDYPIFAKAGAIIPLSKKAEIDNPHDLEIQVFPGNSNIYNLYEDDGYSKKYQDGEFLITQIKYDYKPNNFNVNIKAIEGNLSVVPSKRNIEVRFKNSKNADILVMVNNQEYPYKSHLSGKDLVVETENVPTSAELHICVRGNNIEIDALRVINDDIDDIIMSLLIPTNIKDIISEIMFSGEDIKKKRIRLRKLKAKGLDKRFVQIFLKLLDYISEF